MFGIFIYSKNCRNLSPSDDTQSPSPKPFDESGPQKSKHAGKEKVEVVKDMPASPLGEEDKKRIKNIYVRVSYSEQLAGPQ